MSFFKNEGNDSGPSFGKNKANILIPPPRVQPPQEPEEIPVIAQASKQQEFYNDGSLARSGDNSADADEGRGDGVESSKILSSCNEHSMEEEAPNGALENIIGALLSFTVNFFVQ